MNWRPIGELQHDRDERPQVAKCTPIQLAICQNWDKIAVERVIMKRIDEIVVDSACEKE